MAFSTYNRFPKPIIWLRQPFPKQIKDSATGLNYMQQRYYDPVIGRFLSIDPVTFIGSGGDPRYFNRYAYAGNDPINNLDPDGQQISCRSCRFMKPMNDRRKREIVETAVDTHTKAAIGMGLMLTPVDETTIAVGAVAKGAQALKGTRAVKTVKIDSTKSPEAAQHIKDAGYDGKTLTVDRAGANARRAETLDGTPTKPGMDRDEVPPAVFQERRYRSICSSHQPFG